MFDIGFLELLVIGVVALLVLGPKRLPEAARTAGMWIGKIKRTVSGMQREINAQLEAEELREKLNEQQKKLDESLNKVKRDVEHYAEPDTSADTTDSTATNSTRPTEDTPTQKSDAAPGGNEPLADSAPSSSDKDFSNR